MLSALETFHTCRERGIEIKRLVGGLIQAGPKELLTDELRAALRANKTELLALVPPRHSRPVFEYQISDFPGRHVMLGIPGETLEQARLILADRYAERLLEVSWYEYPPRTTHGESH